MAKIDVYMSEMSLLSTRLKQISSLVDDAEQITSRVQSNLDFQVAAKENIAGGLSKVKRNLRKQKDKVRNLSDMTAVSEGEFRKADNQMDKKAYAAINKISTPLFNRTYGAKSLFVGMALARHKKINDFFLPAGTIIGIAGLGAMIRRLMEFIRKWKEHPIVPVTPSGDGNIVGSTKPYENLIAFSSASYAGKTNGNYADYSIVGGMKPEYCYNQSNTEEYGSWFNRNGCLACADACAASIMGKGVLNPEKEWTGAGKYTTRIGLNTKDDSYNWTPERIREMAYQELTQGKPVVIGVQSGTSDAGGHSVVVVGLRNGADPNHLTDADFLIMDPGDGKIKALSERKKVGNSDTCIKPRWLNEKGQWQNAGIRRVR